jgi:GNAT superfamily N-acetyltransferase
MNDRIVIRNYRPEDDAVIEDITYRTGLNGENLAGKSFIDDRRLFYLIFIYYYTHYEPGHFFVAVDNQDEQVIGFIGGTTDTARQEKRFRRKMIPRILARGLFVTTWRYPSTLLNLLKMSNISGAVDHNRMLEIVAQHPAHLHINMMPGRQGLGVGGRLIAHFEEHIRAQGVFGLHLTTSNYHHKAIPFYHKNGYQIAYESAVVPHPLLDDYKLLTFVKRLDP